MTSGNEEGRIDPIDPSAGDPWNGDKVADFEAALARLDGNRQLLTDMINFFWEDIPELLKQLDQGLCRQDAAAVQRAAHSIKGLAASFEAQRVSGCARHIEELASHNRLSHLTPRLEELRKLIAELESALAEFNG